LYFKDKQRDKTPTLIIVFFDVDLT